MNAALWLFAGLAWGAVHFALLRRNTLLYLDGNHLAFGLALQALRLAAVVALLVLAVRHGALPLLLAALGVLSSRPIMLRALPVAP